ncbi:MAG: MFS transporter, partial [Puniceicoccales bacterium]|nr:MFS transporter [Puniceicoccales bacterium]
MKAKSGRQAYWNWALLSAFFSYQYLLRIYPGIFIEDIRLNFRMSAPEFAKLSTYCMHTYSLLQIPAGLLLDYVRIRPVVLVSLGLCLLGNFVLLNTTSPTSAQWSRILVGVGSACAFIGALKTASDHFP